MRDEFKDIMNQVVENNIVNVIIDKDDGKTYIVLSQPSLLKIRDSLFLIPPNMTILVDERGIAIQEFEECNQCEHKDCMSPIGTEKELNEYMEQLENGDSDTRETTAILKADIDNVIDMSIFKNRGGNC